MKATTKKKQWILGKDPEGWYQVHCSTEILLSMLAFNR